MGALGKLGRHRRRLLAHVFLTALVVYDFVITFDQEVASVWRRKFTAASLLFFINRYLNTLGSLPISLLPFSVWTPSVSFFHFRLTTDCYLTL